MAFCTKCGAQVNDQSSFCTSCGQPVSHTQKNAQSGMPTFTPPTPSFIPPAPTFSSPARRQDGPVCYHHAEEPAAGQCARCGKYVCRDCADAYTVTIGEYANKCLCYDCCQQLVAENLTLLEQNKSKIRSIYIMTIIGMIIGGVLGIAAGPIGVIIFALIGGCFWTFLKGWFKRLFHGWAGGGFSLVSFVFALFIGLFIEMFLSIYRTIRKIIDCRKYSAQTANAIEEDSRALQNMRDYMEYTLVRSQNKGVDLETLMGQGSELYNNSYAQTVVSQGEAAADAMIRQGAATIAENGEIIRSFAAAA